MLVSIIIPCFNVENYITECIESSLAQTYSQIEIICIDNNSSDNTWPTLQDLKQKHPQIIIDRELKPGAPVARNKGLSLAKGEWVQFLDADDLILPQKIEHQVSLLPKKGNNLFIAGSAIFRNVKVEERVSIVNPGDVQKLLFLTNLGNTCSNLWNSTLIRQIGGWDENLKSSQEADLMFQLLKRNASVIFDNEPLTIIRERPSGQISQRDPKEKWLQYVRKRIEFLDWLVDNRKEYYQENKSWYDNSLFENLRTLAKYDFNTANEYFFKYIGDNFELKSKSKLYKYLFKLLGFKKTELLYKIFHL